MDCARRTCPRDRLTYLQVTADCLTRAESARAPRTSVSARMAFRRAAFCTVPAQPACALPTYVCRARATVHPPTRLATIIHTPTRPRSPPPVPCASAWSEPPSVPVSNAVVGPWARQRSWLVTCPFVSAPAPRAPRRLACRCRLLCPCRLGHCLTRLRCRRRGRDRCEDYTLYTLQPCRVPCQDVRILRTITDAIRSIFYVSLEDLY